MMVHQGMSTDRELARIWHAEALQQAAWEQENKRRGTVQPGEAARLILLAGSVIGMVLVIWLLAVI